MTAILLDQKIKAALDTWRAGGYDGASPITRRLLEFWFREEHLLDDGTVFTFYAAQRQAIEALIYLYEKCGYRNLYELAKGFGVPLQFDVTTDNWAKYCFKMATGSGKTFVMALAIAWQYFNRLHRTDNRRRYTSDFLLVAPNLIVLDRLAEAFENSAIFKQFPFIPPEWEADFHLQVIVQNQVTAAHGTGTLYLTNVQQLYEQEEERPKNVLHEALGRPVIKGQSLGREELQDRLLKERNLLVLNDEAHHVHSDDLEWAKAIARIQDIGKARGDDGLVMQLDFSATPYKGSGEARQFFPHIISDYPLAAAIRDRVVKRPKIGEIENPPATASKDFVKQNQLQIDTGVEVFRLFQKDLAKIGKKPVLFVMTDNTKNADRVGEYLSAAHALPTLVIHTDAKGSITKSSLEVAREAARSIDANQYHAIVSVMMLKEGWDVKNVCVIVPLRSYESSILAEQTLGRGLRRMTPDEIWEEKLVVIDHPKFRALWQAEIQNEDLDIEITTAKRVYEASNPIAVDMAKMRYDVSFPVLSGGITRDVRRVADLDVGKLPRKPFVFRDIKLPKVMYTEKDLLTQRTELQREIAFDYTDRYDVFLTGVTKAVLARCAASAQFAEVVPKVRAYIEERCFDRPVDMSDPDVVRKLNFLPVREWLRDVFTDAILKLEVVTEPYEMAGTFAASATSPFHTSEPVHQAKKTVFEQLPYPRNSAFERDFMVYLDDQKQKEVLAYTKVLVRMPLRIPYHDADGYLRHYRPDFIVKTADGFWLIETKGAGWDKQGEVEFKVGSAREWCARVSEFTKQPWRYAKVVDTDFARFQSLPLKQLLDAVEQPA
ncbi:MAG: DEAD/DEAH box helicase family protein [bacterium]